MAASRHRSYKLHPITRFIISFFLLLYAVVWFHDAVAEPLVPTERFFSHIAVGTNGSFDLTTSFAIHNSGQEPIDVRIEIYFSDGSSFVDETRHLEAGFTDEPEFRSLDPPQGGWARLSSEQGSFLATEFLQLVQNGSRTGVLPSTVANLARSFAWIDDVAETGLAIANPFSEETRVQIQLLNAPGGLREIVLPGRNHSAHLLSEIFDGLGNYHGAIQVLASPLPVIVLTLTQERAAPDRLSTVAVETPVGIFDSVGIGTARPGERLHILNGNVLIQSDREQDLRFQRTAVTTRNFMDPIFSLGRIQHDSTAMDDSPNFRIRFSDDSAATTDPENPEAEPGWPVLKLDSKGIVASVKPRFGPEAGRSSHFEGFIDGDREPLFRLNSYPDMQLEFGAGGDQQTDAVMRRTGDGELAFINRPAPGEDLRETMRIASTGNVGIGTPNPAFSRLHVASGIDQFILEDNDGTADERLWLFTADSGLFNLRTASDDFMSFDDAIVIERSGVEVVNVSYPTAKLGIGTTRASTADLHVVGSAWFTEGISSSRRLKENVAPLSKREALEALRQLQPVAFNYKDDEEGGLQLGFISEDVPELVSTPRRQGVRPMDLIAILTRVVQQQQERIEALEEAVKKEDFQD